MNSKSPARRVAKILIAIAALFLLASWTACAAFGPYFQPIKTMLTNELALIASIEHPSPHDRARSNVLAKANAAIDNPAFSDGKTLRTLLRLLQGPAFSYCTAAINESAVNARNGVIHAYERMAVLVSEMPPGPKAVQAHSRYDALGKYLGKLAA